MINLTNILFKRDNNFSNNTYFLLDNLAAHTSKVFRSICSKLGLKIILTHGYSPEFNPVEFCFDLLKK